MFGPVQLVGRMPSSFLRLVSSQADRPRQEGDERPLLGTVLARSGLVSNEQLEAGLRAQDNLDARLGEVLVAEGGLEQKGLREALEEQWQARHIDLVASPPDPQLIDRLGANYCLENGLLPWRRIGVTTVICAVFPDKFTDDLPRLEKIFGPVMLGLVTEEDHAKAIASLFAEPLNKRAETRAPPEESCRRWDGKGLGLILAALAGFIALSFAVTPAATFAVLTLIAMVSLIALTGLKVLTAWAALSRKPERESAKILALRDQAAAKLPVVSLLVPLFKEECIAEKLVTRLSRLRYPSVLLDICLVIETDDLVTLSALKKTELPPWFRIVRVPHGTVRTKPRALNYALDFCRGKIVGVYDAEDEPDPDQIERIVDRFQRSGPEVACLQGRLAFYNSRDTFLTRCFAIDYASWFSVVLPGIARLGLVVPLGGTTLFFRRAVLDELGAWDAHNVTEDADLGLRLARRGYRTELVDTTTCEEATLAPWAWIRQRSRWLKGYAMTYAVHMRNPSQLLQDLGWRGFLGVQTMFLGTLVQAALAPVLWSWWLLLFGLPHPLGGQLSFYVVAACTALMVMVEALTLFVGGLALYRTGQSRLMFWLPIMNLYNMMTTLAISKALFEMVTKPFYWDKTQHGGEL